MKKCVLTALCMVLLLCGCNDVDTKTFYENNHDDLLKAIEYFEQNPTIEKVTKESPFLVNRYYSKCGSVYYVTDTKDKIEMSDDIHLINELMEKVVYIFIDNTDDELFVQFVTSSKLGESESLVYTKTGNEYPDGYDEITEWLDDNWYISAY